MSGHVRKRTYSNGTVRFRARHPNPLGDGTDQIERTFARRKDAETWLNEVSRSYRSGL